MNLLIYSLDNTCIPPCSSKIINTAMTVNTMNHTVYVRNTIDVRIVRYYDQAKITNYSCWDEFFIQRGDSLLIVDNILI